MCCRKPRVPRWRLHICVRSRAPGHNTADVTVVPDQTGTVVGWSRSMAARGSFTQRPSLLAWSPLRKGSTLTVLEAVPAVTQSQDPISPGEFRRQCWRHRRSSSTERWTSQLCNREHRCAPAGDDDTNSAPNDVLLRRFCPQSPFPQALWDLVSECPPLKDHGTACVSPCRLPCHSLDTSFRPTNQSRTLLTAPILTTSFLTTLRCLSVHGSQVFRGSMARTGSSQTPSFNSSHPCLIAHVVQ